LLTEPDPVGKLNSDGSFNANVDCINGSVEYDADEDNISIMLGISTIAACLLNFQGRLLLSPPTSLLLAEHSG
jgi:hypothetical protein